MGDLGFEKTIKNLLFLSSILPLGKNLLGLKCKAIKVTVEVVRSGS